MKIRLSLGMFAIMAVLAFSLGAANQNNGGWLDPVFPKKGQDTTPSKPAPHHDLSGLWGVVPAGDGIQAGGVQAVPNDGKPGHQLPYTPYGLKVYKSHKPVEGFDAVPPGEYNDPRELCEPLGFPRSNHYQVRLTQILQDNDKIAMLYQYNNRWRIIWTDGRQLPTLVDGGVKTGDIFRAPRFYGYSVGKWVDDTTLVVQTDGTMPEDRVWLDATGRPISDQIKVTETLHRIDYNTLQWKETIDDRKMYTKPWVTMNFEMKLMDPRTDVLEFYCSPVEMQRYDKLVSSQLNSEPKEAKPKK